MDAAPQHLICVLVKLYKSTCIHMHLLLYSIVLDLLYCIVYCSLFHLKHFILSAVPVALFALSPFSTYPSSYSCCCILPATSVIFYFCCTLPAFVCCILPAFFLLHSSVVAFFLPTLLLHSSCYFRSTRAVCSNSSAKFHVAITRTACRNPGFQAQ